ncbi:hypothetical protein OUZ56_022853 [Daphnia magna]|uniref:Uncharacterized protein n=1 Tax=Daphnia magna TaxID=35525 RepID=A0ABR0AXS7_9CRUS|nr:hypothetical protein OUZ56_022853 [Daphnia magna]
MAATMGLGSVYGLYAASCLMAVVFVIFCLPETKGILIKPEGDPHIVLNKPTPKTLIELLSVRVLRSSNIYIVNCYWQADSLLDMDDTSKQLSIRLSTNSQSTR